MKEQTKRVVVVTGASSGIGKETVDRFLREGYEVYAAARRVDAMADLASRGAHVLHLDLTTSASIDALVATVLARSGRIDVLVNNAGYGSYGAVEDVPMAAARDQMEVNLFGLAHLIQATLPTMRAQRSGRIINITSIGGKIWSLLGAWYHASKFAVEGFSDALRNEVRPFGIDVVVIEPGAIKTEWAGVAADNMRKTSGHGPYKPLVDKMTAMFTGRLAEKNAAPPSVIANAIWRAASVRRPRARYVAPFAGKVILWLRYWLSDRAFDWLFGKLVGAPKTLGA